MFLDAHKSRAVFVAWALAAAWAVSAAAAAERTELSGDAPLWRHSVEDRGALAPDAALERLQLALKRPAALQARLDALTAAQQDPASPQFHKWLTPQQFAAEFAPPAAEVAKVTRWLLESGLRVDEVAGSSMSVAFSGTVAQVTRAFGSELHDVVRADGAHRVANVAAPSVPAELAGIVDGVTLSNFFPHASLRPVGVVRRDGRTGRAEVTQPAPAYTTGALGETYYAVTPQDLATIYDFNPARDGAAGLGAPLTGSRVKVIVAEQTDINPADWRSFRAAFGLSGYAGTLQIVHPGGCADPGITGDEGEAALDAEWASAAAPAAMIIVASCAGTATTFGVMTTLQNLVSSGPLGAVISVSYGGCESGNGAAFQSMWAQLVQQAAAEGISVFVSAGDNLSAGCDDDDTAELATSGLAVNGLASTPFDTAVGGTDFSDTADGANAAYWSAANTASDGSALSYIPEIPWDESCASSVIVTYVGARDALSSCNERDDGLLDIVGGSGGQSVVYGKPSWQSPSIPGVANDGVRGLPDVSMFASSGIWSHFLLFCMSDANEGGAPCLYTDAGDLQANAAGGTSFAAPVMAGIEALVVQRKGASQGNAAPRLYALAQTEFESAATLAACNSSNGPTRSRACVFRPVTRGDSAAPCATGSPNCFSDSESRRRIGVLSTSTSREQDAYPTALGWSFATGLGSVDVTNLLAAY